MRTKLVELREKKGLTQEEVAAIVGISRSFYGLIETGLRNPTYGLAKKIAQIFNVDAESLFLDLDSFRMKLDINNILTGTEDR